MAYRHMEDIYRGYHFNISSDELAQNLSASMLQQVEIVKILHQGVDIIISDESIPVLTPQGIQGLSEAIHFLVKNDKTVLFITHKLEEVMEISGRITVLKNGHYVDTVKPDGTDEHNLVIMMTGRGIILIIQKEEKKQEGVLFQVRHLSVPDYEGREKLEDVPLEIRRGKVPEVADVAGSGQQELVEELFGLRDSSRGEVFFDGKDITSPNRREHRMCHIRYVSQDHINEGISQEATLRGNAVMDYHIMKRFGNRYLLKRKQAISSAEYATHDFNVKASSPSLRIRILSGGNIQKLIIGREFLRDNRLLVIEDPTQGADIDAIEFIQKKIESLAGAEAIILLISHELSEVVEVLGRILVMYDKQLYDGGIHGEETETETGFLMTGSGRA